MFRKLVQTKCLFHETIFRRLAETALLSEETIINTTMINSKICRLLFACTVTPTALTNHPTYTANATSQLLIIVLARYVDKTKKNRPIERGPEMMHCDMVQQARLTAL